MTKEGTESLAKLQREILEVVRNYVKEGGALVYSTCTINPAENLENVRWFLDNSQNLKQRILHHFSVENFKRMSKKDVFSFFQESMTVTDFLLQSSEGRESKR